MEKKLKTPQLRFNEFSNEWEKKILKDLIERTAIPVKIEKDKKYKQIGIKSHGKGLFYKETVTGEELGNKRVFWIKENAFIVNIVFAWEQAVAKTTEKEVGMIASHRFPMYLPKINQCDLNYLHQFFLTRKGKILLELASPGGAGRNKTLGQKEFEKLKLNIPSYSEQIKISSFLDLIDKRIELTQKKKELLDQYKKGVMQKVFSQEIRFKDEAGKEFPKWQKLNLSDILTIPDKIKPKIVDKNKLLTVKLHLKGVLLNENTDNLSIGSTNYYKRKNGQFIYGKQNLFNGAFGIIPDELDGCLSSGDVPSLNIKTEFIDPLFLFYFLGRESFYKSLEKISSGSGSKRIHEKTLLKVSIELPNLSEQIKILGFLKILDEKIKHCQIQIEKMEQWKKGLLQKMFV